MLIPRTKFTLPVLLGLGLLILTSAVWWSTRPDPRARFLADIDDMLATANAFEHTKLLERLSPEARQKIADEFMQPLGALRWVAQADMNQNRAYRFTQLTVFYPRDYAEIEVERSAAGREFTGEGRFLVPFIWRDGAWWVADGFRGEREWTYPE
jgi:hypothetical protein